MHFPWSPNLQNDDRMLQSTDSFVGRRVIVTEKMDGENTSMYSDHIHARSIDSKYHPSREWVKGFWGNVCHDIPRWLRICGENMYAQHSITYDNLESFFLGFSVWYDDQCINWDETLEWFELLGIAPVPIWYDGIYSEEKLHELWEQYGSDDVEGYVVRASHSISLEEFPYLVGKYVRKNHVRTDEFWMHKQVVPNQLRKHQ